MASLVGCWVQVSLFRRPMLSVFTRVYTVLSRIALDDGTEYELLPFVMDALLACTFLALTAIADLCPSATGEQSERTSAPPCPQSCGGVPSAGAGAFGSAIGASSKSCADGGPLGPELTHLRRDLGLPPLMP
eukprot:1573442-Pyramimonas_sp.AAC.1